METNSHPIKILIPVKYPVGGIRTYLKYTYGKLDKNKYMFFLASQDVKWLKIVKEDLPNHQVRIVNSRYKNESLAMAGAVWKAFREDGIDLIHSQGYTAGLITCLLNLFFRKPHIITLHHVFKAGQFSDSFWNTLPKVKGLLIETLLKTANRIQPVSFDAKDNLLENFPGLRKRSGKVVAISNGIDVESFISAGPVNDEEEFLGNSKDFFVIGFLGRYMPEKGFPHVIDVADSLVNKHQITDFKIAAIGNFGGFVREYRKEIERRSLTEYFCFFDFRKNVFNALKQLHVVLIPSLGEACPLVPMEALITGTPVIAFSCIGLREVLKDTPGIMVPVKDVAAMTSEIIRVKRNYKDVKGDFEKFVPEAMKRYDSSNTARELEKLFREVLAEKK